jgi:hypothetical protein
MTEQERNLIEQEVREKGLLQFRAFDKHVRDALINNEIIFGAAKNFNDPFDCNLLIDLENSSIEIITDYLKIADKKHSLSDVELLEKAKFYFENKSEFEKRLRSPIYDYRRFSCFQIDNDENSHRDILFWANYANKNTGICMKFNGGIIEAKFHFNGNIQSIPIDYLDYEKEIPEFNYLKYRVDKSNFGYERAKELNGGRGPSEYFFGIKSTKWEYEKEVRFVYESLSVPFLEQYEKVKFNPKMLERVYLGCKAKQEDILKIFQLPKYEHVAVYKLVMDKKFFKLNEERLK